MRAGALRHRVTLQSRALERDTSGQVKQTYTNRLTVWASIEPQRGRELFAGEKFANQISVVVHMRYQPDVDESWRIVRDTPSMGTETYGILGIVRPYAIKRELVMACQQMTMGEPV